MTASYVVQLGFKVDSTQLKQFQQQLDKTEKSLKDTSTGVNGLSKNLMSFVKGAGIGIAIGAITGAIFGLGKAVTSISKHIMDGEKEMAALQSVIKSTGGVAGYSAEQIDSLSNSLSRTSTISTGEINEAAARMLTYTNIVGEKFPEAMQIAVDWSARYGVSVSQAAETVGKALDNPASAMAALSKQGFKFSDDLKKQIQTLVDVGKIAEAQALVMEQITEGTEGAAEALRNTLGGAMDNLRNRVDDLLGGNTGGLQGVTDAINHIADVISDPGFQEAFGSLIGFFAEIVSNAASAVMALTGGGNSFAHALDALVAYFRLAKTQIEIFVTGLAGLAHTAVNAAIAIVKALTGDWSGAKDAYGDMKNSATTAIDMVKDKAVEGAGYMASLVDSTGKMMKGVAREAKNAVVDMTPRGVGTPTGLGSGTSGKASVDPSKKANDAAVSALASMQEQLALSGKNLEIEKMLYQTQDGRFKNASEALKGQLLLSAGLLDQAKEDVRIQEAQKAGKELITDLEAQTALNADVLSKIKAGELRTDQQIAQYKEDAAYWRGIDKQILDGTLVLSQKELDILKEKYKLQKQQAVDESDTQDKREKRDQAHADGIAGLSNMVGTAFDRMWEGQSVKFGDLLKDFAKQWLRSAILRSLTHLLGGGEFSSLGSAFMGMANGGAFNKGVQFYAKGDVFNSPTAFGHRGGLGVLGEAGPEAIMPLTRGPNGKLGVVSHGSSGGTVNIAAGAVVVNATEDSAADANKTARAIETLIDTRIAQRLKEASRTGNQLNRQQLGRY